MTERMIVSFERALGGNHTELARKPNAVDLFQSRIAIEPTKGFRSCRFSFASRSLPGLLRRRAEQAGFGMHEKQIPTIAALRHGNDSASVIAGIKHADFPIVHECMPLHELEQMRFDVRANDAVGFDGCAGFRIDVVP
ncbi:MAG: hypothetical protein ACTHLW_03960 [Verrucomicrobiota bacterium]